MKKRLMSAVWTLAALIGSNILFGMVALVILRPVLEGKPTPAFITVLLGSLPFVVACVVFYTCLTGRILALRILAGLVAIVCMICFVLILRKQLTNGFGWLEGSLSADSGLLAMLCGLFALWGHVMDTRAILRSALMGGLTIGGISFALGFFGPMILTPKSNQGPMLGIFITGPIGFGVGLLVGAIVGCIRKRSRATAPGAVQPRLLETD